MEKEEDRNVSIGEIKPHSETKMEGKPSIGGGGKVEERRGGGD